MGDRLGTLRAVGISFCYFFKFISNVIYFFNFININTEIKLKPKQRKHSCSEWKHSISEHHTSLFLFLYKFCTSQDFTEAIQSSRSVSHGNVKTVFHRIISVVRLHVLLFQFETVPSHDEELWRFFLSVKPACR